MRIRYPNPKFKKDLKYCGTQHKAAEVNTQAKSTPQWLDLKWLTN